MPRPLANDLVDRLLAARDQRIAELEAALDKYGTHLCSCALRQEMGRLDSLPVCTCGLDAARKEE